MKALLNSSVSLHIPVLLILLITAFNGCSTTGLIDSAWQSADESAFREKQKTLESEKPNDEDKPAPGSSETAFEPGDTYTDPSTQQTPSDQNSEKTGGKEKSVLFDEKTGTGKKTEKKDSGKSLPVYYAGNRFVREVKYIPRLNRKDVELSIRGNARVKRGKSIFRAVRITILGKDSKVITAQGRVNFYDPLNRTQLKAGYGELMRDENRLIIRDQPVVVHKSRKSGRLELRAREMERRLNSKIVTCYGNVRLQGDDITAVADKAELHEAEEKVILTGSPRIFYGDNILLAERMIIYNAEDRAELFDQVKLFLTERNEDQKNKKKTEQTITTIIDGGYGDYRYAKKIKYGRRSMITYPGSSEKRVLIRRTDSTAYARRVTAFGSEPQEIIAEEQVRMVSHEDDTVINGDRLFYSQPEALARVSAVDRQPTVTFYENDEKQGILAGEVIERNLLNDILQARGGVTMTMNPEDKQPGAIIRGQWARMTPEKTIHVFGNPSVEQGTSLLYGREIVIFPNENRFKMSGDIRGSFSD